MKMAIVMLCIVCALIIGIGAHLYADFRKNSIKCQCSLICEKIKKISLLSWIEIVAFSAALGLTCFQLLKCQLDMLFNVRVIAAAYILFTAAIIDMHIKKIPNGLILTGIGLYVILTILEWIFCKEAFFQVAISSLCGIIFFFFLFLLLSIVTKHGIGMGDVKLMAVLGGLAGAAGTFYALTYGMCLCLIATIGMLALHKKGLKDSLPLGPFLYLGYCMAVIVGTF